MPDSTDDRLDPDAAAENRAESPESETLNDLAMRGKLPHPFDDTVPFHEPSDDELDEELTEEMIDLAEGIGADVSRLVSAARAQAALAFLNLPLAAQRAVKAVIYSQTDGAAPEKVRAIALGQSAPDEIDEAYLGLVMKAAARAAGAIAAMPDTDEDLHYGDDQEGNQPVPVEV